MFNKVVKNTSRPAEADAGRRHLKMTEEQKLETGVGCLDSGLDGHIIVSNLFKK